MNVKRSTPGFSLKLICHKIQVEILLPEMTRGGKLIPKLCVSICNPVELVKTSLMQNTRIYLPGFFASNHLQMSLICPFWNICWGKPCFLCSLLWSQAFQRHWKTELLTGAKTPWILFTVSVAVIENVIHSKVGAEPLNGKKKKPKGWMQRRLALQGMSDGGPRRLRCRLPLSFDFFIHQEQKAGLRSSSS